MSRSSAGGVGFGVCGAGVDGAGVDGTGVGGSDADGTGVGVGTTDGVGGTNDAAGDGIVSCCPLNRWLSN